MLKRMGCAQGRKNVKGAVNIHTNYIELQNTEFTEFGSG